MATHYVTDHPYVRSDNCPSWCGRHIDQLDDDGRLVDRSHYSDDADDPIFTVGAGEDLATGKLDTPEIDLNVRSFWGEKTIREAIAELEVLAVQQAADGWLD